MHTYYFSTHGGAGPLRSSFEREFETFLNSPGPNLPVFKKACMLFLPSVFCNKFTLNTITEFLPAHSAAKLYYTNITKQNFLEQVIFIYIKNIYF